MNIFKIILITFTFISLQTFSATTEKQNNEESIKDDECNKTLKALADYFTHDNQSCSLSGQPAAQDLSSEIKALINIGINQITKSDRTLILSSQNSLPESKQNAEKTLEQFAQQNPDLKESLNFLKQNNVPLIFQDINGNPECGRGAALSYDQSSAGGMRVEVCLKNTQLNVLKGNIIHEVIHIKQFLNHSKEHHCSLDIEGKPHSVSSFLNYNVHPKLISEVDENLKTLPFRKEFDEVASNFDHIEKYFYLNYDGSKMNLIPKKPASVSEADFYRDLEKKFDQIKNGKKKIAAEEFNMVHPELSELLKANPDKSAKEVFELFANHANNKLSELKKKANKSENDKLDLELNTYYVKKNRILPALQTFCMETQAYINQITDDQNIYSRIKKIIPSCTQAGPFFNKDTFDDNLSIEESEKLIEKKALSRSKKGSTYANSFSEMYGLTDFNEIFNKENCQNPKDELWNYKPSSTQSSSKNSPSDIEANFQNKNKAKPKEAPRVAFDNTGIPEVGATQLITGGLDPCIAVLYKAKDKAGKIYTCLSHVPWNPSSFTNGRADHQEHIVQRHFDECKSKLSSQGADVSNMSVLMHSKEKGQSAESSNNTPSSKNAASLVDFFSHRPEVGKFVEHYNSESQLRTFKYDLEKQRFEIWSEPEDKYESPKLLSSGDF